MLLRYVVFILFFFYHGHHDIECSPVPTDNALWEDPIIITFKQVLANPGNNNRFLSPPNYITNFCYRTIGSNFDIPLNFTLLRYTEGSEDIVKHVLISINNVTSSALEDVGAIIPMDKCILQRPKQTQGYSTTSTPTPTVSVIADNSSLLSSSSSSFIDLFVEESEKTEEESTEDAWMLEHSENISPYTVPLNRQCTDESAMAMEQRLRINARNFSQHISFNGRLMYIMYVDGFPLVCDVIKLDDRAITSIYDYRCLCPRTDERFRRYNAQLSREEAPPHVQEFVNNMLRAGQYIKPVIGYDGSD